MTGSYDNRMCNVLVLGDSHVYWLEQFVAHDLLLLRYPQDVNAIDIVYRGTRVNTVSSLHRDAVFPDGGHDLPHAGPVVRGNDVDKCGVPPQLVGIEIYTLARDLMRSGTVFQILCSNSWETFLIPGG